MPDEKQITIFERLLKLSAIVDLYSINKLYDKQEATLFDKNISLFNKKQFINKIAARQLLKAFWIINQGTSNVTNIDTRIT